MRFGPKNLDVSCTGEHLTHFGGVYLLHQCFQYLGLRSRLYRTLRFAQRNTDYSVAEMTLAVIYPILLGLGRIETTYLLRTHGVFQWLTGLPTIPHPTTLRRFLKRLHPRGVTQLLKVHDALRQRMVRRCRTLVLDMDSTVLTVYGQREQTAVGYNPVQRGRKSYHPLLAFEARTQTSWHAVLRPGDATSAEGSAVFLATCLAKRPALVRRVLIRADAGFYDKTTVGFLNAHKVLYVIPAKLTARLKRVLPRVRYHPLSHGWEVGECTYPPRKWPAPARFVAVRYRLAPRADEETRQLTLFPVTIGRYGYRAYVTTLRFTPANVWRFYRGRAGIELIIKELKGEATLAQIPTKFFGANDAYFHLWLLAYDLANAFKKMCLPPPYHQASLRTLRAHLCSIPGILIRSGRRSSLKLPRHFPHHKVFLTALNKTRHVRW